MCIINDEKSEALIRIIEAGRGKAVRYDISGNNKNKYKIGDFTLIVYSDELKSVAEGYSIDLNIPCYPYQSIPDYLMLVI